MLALTEPLPREHGNELAVMTGQPWAVEMQSGERCVLLSGASTIIAGHRMNYYCDINSRYLYEVDLEAGVALVQAEGSAMERVPIARIWV